MAREVERNRRLVERLNTIPGAKFILKEAARGRGHPDVMGCVHGQMVVLELKRRRVGKSPGTRLQRIQIEEWRKAGAIATFIVGPENYDRAVEDLRTFAGQLATSKDAHDRGLVLPGRPGFADPAAVTADPATGRPGEMPAPGLVLP